ncbi:MAG: hypothetical protein WBP43_08725 [Chitinophagales bacterium]
MTKWTTIFLTATLLSLSQTSYGQTDSTAHKNNKDSLENISLIYFYVGDGCPFCNLDHPETKYGFKIECVGCNMTKEIEDNNIKVSKALDKKYGNRWTEEYIRSYCESMDLKIIDR